MKSRWFRLIGHEPNFDNSNLRALLPAQKQKAEHVELEVGQAGLAG